MTRLYILSLLFVVTVLGVKAQQFGIENQYFLNPWVYNPAQFDAQQTVLSLSHRNQWAGLEGTPTITRLAFQNYNVGQAYFGLSLVYFSDGPFDTYESLASFGYKAQFSEVTSLNFGLSLGYGSRNINLNELTDPSDVDFTDASFLQGNFGIHLKIGKASIGASIPRLLDESITANEFVGISSPQLFLFSGSYMLEASANISIEPQLLYHINNNLNTKQFEVIGTAYYNDRIWAGAMFRQEFGASAHVGLNIDKYDFGYIYSLGAVGANIQQASHEIVLRMRVGKKRGTSESVNSSTVAANRTEISTSKKAKNRKMAKEPEPAPQSFVDVLDENGSIKQLKAGYYLILGEYFLKSSALRARNELAETGIATKLYFIESKGSNFLFTDFSYSTSSEADAKVDEIKDQSGYEQVRVLYVGE
ncbi:MAG: PorP/SprF family type IX secretion system membrane protein [Bacteroidota bacterium]